MKRINFRDLLTPLENAAYTLPINMHITVSLKTTQIPPFDSSSLASHYCSKAVASHLCFSLSLTFIEPLSMKFRLLILRDYNALFCFLRLFSLSFSWKFPLPLKCTNTPSFSF